MTAIPVSRDQAAATGPGIPRIRFWSWLGLESIGWGVVITHLVHWAGNMAYYMFWQTRFSVGAAASGDPLYTWNAKDFWDRFVIHAQNALPTEVPVTVGLISFAVCLLRLTRVPEGVTAGPLLTAVRWLVSVLAGAGAGLLTTWALRGWRVDWLASQQAPLWWITWRHDIRDVGIAFFTTVIVQLMFARPRYALDDAPSLRQYVMTVPVTVAATLVPVTAIGVAAWQLPWLAHLGFRVPAGLGVLASEINGFVESGELIAWAMGISAGLAARWFVRRIADDIQWFVAERSVTKLRAGGLNALRGGRVYGTPAHRLRVHWIVDHHPQSPDRSPLLVRVFIGAGAIGVLLSIGGAILTLAGAAAVH